MGNNLDNTKNTIIKSFEDFKGEKEIWKTPEEISSLSGETVTNINQTILSFDDFVRNSKGKLTTREKYEENTPTWKKIIHSLRHEI